MAPRRQPPLPLVAHRKLPAQRRVCSVQSLATLLCGAALLMNINLVIFVLERERERVAAPAAASAASVAPAAREDWADLEDFMQEAESTAAAAQPVAHGAAPMAEPELEYDVTLVSQTSEDRVWMVDHLATRWGGPVAIAVYVDDGKALRRYRRQLERLRERGDSSVVKVARPPGGGGAYPINRLRNIALREVRTTHLLLTDIDLWPSTNARSAALALSGPRYLAQPHLALVLPAFEYQGGSDGKDASPSELPESFGELESCMGANGNRARCAIFKHATDTHLTTDYDRWWMQDEPASIPCFRSLRYEPYLIVPRLNSTPTFDERFIGYGKNKIQWVQHLRLAGFVFHVLPRAFVVHYPHRESAARANWEDWRDKKDRLFHDFISERMKNASIRTRMCASNRPKPMT